MALSAGVPAPRAGADHKNGQPAGNQADDKQEEEAEAISEPTPHLPGKNPGIIECVRVHHGEYHERADTGCQEGYPDNRADVAFSPTPTAGNFPCFLNLKAP